MEIEKLIIIGTVGLLTSTVSGIGGGGGGFILTPLLIFLGLTPQQAVATGKFGGLGITLGSLEGLTRAKVHRWKVILPLMLLATVIGLLAPLVITRLDNELYRTLLGILLIGLVPIIIIKKTGVKERQVQSWQKMLAVPVLIITMFMQAIFSGGMGSLVVLTLMGLLGMRALEANVTKRFSQVILNSLIVLGLLRSGLIIWQVAAMQFFVHSAGGYVGSKIAIKKGDKFIAYVFAALMFISGLELIFG